MKQEIEPRSPIKQSAIWHSPRIKEKKNSWHFAKKKDRGALPVLNKLINKGKGVFKLGPYEGSLEELKNLAKMRGDIVSIPMGCVNVKIG